MGKSVVREARSVFVKEGVSLFQGVEKRWKRRNGNIRAAFQSSEPVIQRLRIVDEQGLIGTKRGIKPKSVAAVIDAAMVFKGIARIVSGTRDEDVELSQNALRGEIVTLEH
jgi:hypothetical protein